MPTVTGKVEVTYTRSPGPPPTVSVSRVRIIGGRSGDGILDLDPPPAEWVAAFVAMTDKRVEVTYDAGPPLVVSGVRNV